MNQYLRLANEIHIGKVLWWGHKWNYWLRTKKCPSVYPVLTVYQLSKSYFYFIVAIQQMGGESRERVQNLAADFINNKTRKSLLHCGNFTSWISCRLADSQPAHSVSFDNWNSSSRKGIVFFMAQKCWCLVVYTSLLWTTHVNSLSLSLSLSLFGHLQSRTLSLVHHICPDQFESICIEGAATK